VWCVSSAGGSDSAGGNASTFRLLQRGQRTSVISHDYGSPPHCIYESGHDAVVKNSLMVRRLCHLAEEVGRALPHFVGRQILFTG
jgi:hypothetical protein